MSSHSESTPGGAGAQLRLPPHCVRKPQRSPRLQELQRMLRAEGLHTVCEEARCPNRSKCWEQGAVTFMLMGSVCTRACRFCAVATGRPPRLPDSEAPDKIARAAEGLAARHVVLTSVNRDDLPDGGASHFADVLEAVHERRPEATTEVLTPDFQGDLESVRRVCAAHPDVFNHNVETVPSLYKRVRPGAAFARSIAVLAEAKRQRPDAIVKSGLMVGLGESLPEIEVVLRALRSAGVDSLTVGQYLRPTRAHLPVERYWEPEEFETLAASARQLGFAHVASGPLVRSSYNAAQSLAAARNARERQTLQ
jgi:lipoic acid synthetase